jgi:hypothetical protein
MMCETEEPNKAHSANPAMTSLFHAGHQWRGVADERRQHYIPMKNATATLAIALALNIAPARAVDFTDWTSIDSSAHEAYGVLDGIAVTLSGTGVTGSVTNGLFTGFSNPALFSPPLPSSDVVYIQGTRPSGQTYTVMFAAPVRDPIIHLKSLASTVTFSTEALAKRSGDAVFVVAGNTVVGSYNDSPVGYDANGSLQLNGSFTNISFTVVSLPAFTPPDGIYFQIGGQAAVPPQPRLSLQLVSSGLVELSWDTTASVSYQIEACQRLTTNAWGTVGSAILGDGSRFSTNDAISEQSGRFFRVRAWQ